MNTFEKNIQLAALWIRANQERFWALVGGVFLSILFIVLVVHHHETETDDAWFQLGATHGQLMQNKFEESRKSLDAWQARFSGSNAATYAKFMKADLLYKTNDFAQAAQLYADIVQTGKPDSIKPLALSAEADAEEMAGHFPQAQALSQAFLDQYPDHFLSANRYLGQARLAELTGNPAAASSIYERFVLLFPQSPWMPMVKARLQALGHSTALQQPQITAPPLPKS